MPWHQLIGTLLVALGVECLAYGGRMGHRLPKTWSGAPEEWLPEYRRILKRSLVIFGIGAVLILGGIAVFVWGS